MPNTSKASREENLPDILKGIPRYDATKDLPQDEKEDRWQLEAVQRATKSKKQNDTK